jgi:hypothetical protein
MGQPNPFVRFEPATVNNGFEPGLSYTAELYQLIYDEIWPAIDFGGMTIQEAINTLKTVFGQYNNAPYFGGFVLVYPSPWPTITGTQSLEFMIKNPQAYGFDLSQRITLGFDLIDGIVDGWAVDYSGAPTVLSNYTDPLLSVEKEVIRALEIFEQNGAAFFPDYYNYGSGIALSGLARAKDWKFSDLKGYPLRFPVPTEPYQPNEVLILDSLRPDEKYMLVLLGKIVKFAFTQTDQSAIIDYAESLSVADGWTLQSDTNGYSLVEFTFSSSSYSFKLSGQFTDTWLWQRWVNPTGTTAEVFIDEFAGDLPYQPNTGKLYFTEWCDIEQVCFSDGCENTQSEYYQSPAKTGDQWKFNILPQQGNFVGLSSVQIGLFDSDNVFIQEIGSATYPDCKLLNEFPVTISGASFDPLLADIDSNELDTSFSGIDCDGNSLGDLITVPFEVLDIDSITEYAESVIAYINGLDGYSATYELATNLVFTIVIDDVDSLAVAVDYSNNGAYDFSGTVLDRCPSAQQMQAELTIPSVRSGCYRLGLISDVYFESMLLAYSNAIQINNADCFSTMLEFGSAETAIVEGFEYYEGWTQRIRVGMNGGGNKPKIEEEIYRNSDGTYQRPANSSDLILDLHTDYIDLPTQKAMFGATRHPILVWNNQNIFVSGDLDVATTQDYTEQTSFRNLSQMRFQALHQGFQPDNNGCIDC